MRLPELLEELAGHQRINGFGNDLTGLGDLPQLHFHTLVKEVLSVRLEVVLLGGLLDSLFDYLVHHCLHCNGIWYNSFSSGQGH